MAVRVIDYFYTTCPECGRLHTNIGWENYPYFQVCCDVCNIIHKYNQLISNGTMILTYDDFKNLYKDYT